MRYGTNCFVSEAAAKRYYKPYAVDVNIDYLIKMKLMDGEIRIGKPLNTKRGDELVVIEGRYHVEEKS
jgi:hypothetical protein